MLILLLACTGSLTVSSDSATSPGTTLPSDPSTTSDSRDTDPGSPTETGTAETGTAETGDTTWTMPERPDTSSPGSGDPWRYGGGVDYPDVVDPSWPVVTVVDTDSALVAALEAAQPGEIVYIADDAVIDLTDEASVCVNEGVWLAGGRGVDGAAGGLVTVTETWKRPVFSVCGDDVRITGFRLIGADSDECPPEWPDSCTGDIEGDSNCRDCTESSIGIQIKSYDRLEIDNMALAGWSYAATWFTDSVDNAVHHSHIHHTWRQGLGYGVVLTRGGDELVTVDIAWNRLDYNRHAVAGSGEHGQDYDAHDNLVLEHANGHVFDMHGENEGTDNGSELAGGDIRVHDNTVLVDDNYALVVRGRPDHGAWLYDNCLARSSASTAAKQNYFTGNFWTDEDPSGASAPNAYGRTGPQCEIERWCFSGGGVGPWHYGTAGSEDLADLGFGDFDGDGRTDAFQTTGSEWQWSSGGTAAWSKRNTSSYTLGSLAFGDFDGDGQTDVFASSGGEWRISSAGSGGWTTLNADLSDPSSDLAFADFDGDGKTDVFRATGSHWEWSSGGATAWTRLNTSSYTLGSLAFGDFDGDGRADVMRASGTEWAVSYSGSGGWTTLNSSSIGLSSLALADLDGDGRTDVVRRSGTRWVVSWSGSSGWSDLRVESLDPTDLAWGDFDGDGAADAFRTGCF